MSEDQHSGFRRVRERVQDKIVDWMVLAGLGLMATLVFEPVRDFATNLFRGPARLAALVERYEARSESVDRTLVTIRDDINALRRPSEIFEVARSSGPVEGECQTGRPCEIRVVARRTPDGIDCKIISGATGYAFYTSDLLQRFGAVRLDRNEPRNVGLDWTELNITVRTPSLLDPGENFFVIVPVYSKCNGDSDDATIKQESSLIEVKVVRG